MARRSGGRPASRDNRSASGQRQGGPSKGRGGAGGRSAQGGGRGRGAGARGGAPARSQRPQKRDADTQSAQSRRPDRSRAGSKGDLIEGRRAVAEALELGLPVSRALIQKDQGGADQALADLARTFEAAGVEVDRRMLAELAVNDINAFNALVKVAKDALPADINAPKA